MKKLTGAETRFLNSISPAAKDIMKSKKILASVSLAHAILASNWGRRDTTISVNSIFRTKLGNNWYGACYDTETHNKFDRSEDAIASDTLIRAYETLADSLEDWAVGLINARKSPDGPFVYDDLIGEKDYKKAIEVFLLTEYYTDPVNSSKLISLIENYELFKYDKEVERDIVKAGGDMFRVRQNWKNPKDELIATKDLGNAKTVAESKIGYRVFDMVGGMLYDPWISDDLYRVRLDWDKPATQLFVSPILELAKIEAAKHVGYKVFNPIGEVVADPWAKDPEVDKPSPPNKPVSAVILIPKGLVILNNTPIYRLSNSDSPFIFLTGRYIFHNVDIYNGRVRICKEGLCSPIGFIKLADIQ